MGNYVTVSTKVKREVVERARGLGINISEFLRTKLEEEVIRRELELLDKKLREELGDFLEKLDIDRIVKHIREDREGR